jgi:eukaryotic-like serine/threonine-protein kinase
MTEESLFEAALQRPTPAERQAFLEEACGGDAGLLERVRRLLAAHEQPRGVLDRAAADATGTSEAAAPDATLAVGTVIAGRYKVLESLGEGGMGTVLVAEQTEPVRRRVALKVIKPGMDSRRVLARFEAERQALALMDHPHIAKVFDGGLTESGRPFFVMEYIKGVPLTDYCDAARLTVRQRLELFVPVCQAVQHAHQKGIIHRDLKPSNILVALYDGNPVPKVIDFGLAKATSQPLTDHSVYTAHEMILGTPLYMSPEQSELNNLDVDTRTDVYALGVILYELLTGTTPLDGRRLRQAAWDELRRLIREEEPPRPSARLSSSDLLPSLAARRQTEPARLAKLVKGELDWIVMKALEKDRARRYETANGFARDVQRYLADEPVEACPPSAGYRLRKFARKHRRPLAAAAAGTALLVLGAAVCAGQAVRATAAQRQALAAAEAERVAKQQAQEAAAGEQKARQAEAREHRLAEEARRRALEQAAVAQAVSDFLQEDLLGQADVAKQPGGEGRRDRDVKVRTLLDRAARHVAGKFAGQPLTEAAIRLTLGTTYRSLGEFAEARRHLERAVQLRAERLGADHLDTLAGKHELALLYHHQGNCDRAEPLYREVLQARSARLGADHPATLRSKFSVALLHVSRGKYDLAAPLFREVVQANSARLGPDQLLTLRATENLAGIYNAQGKYEQAEPLVREVLQGYADRLGADHPSTLSAKHNLALLYVNQRKYHRAEPLMREVVHGVTTQQGAGGRFTLCVTNDLALLYHLQGKYDRAEPLLRRVADALKQQAGADSPQYAGQLAVLGLNLLKHKKYAEAEAVLRDCLAARDREGPDDWATFNTMSMLGGALLGQKKYADAEPLLLTGYEGMKQREAKIPPPGKVRLTEALERLVHLYEATGQKDKAEEWRKKLEGTRPAKPLAKP